MQEILLRWKRIIILIRICPRLKRRRKRHKILRKSVKLPLVLLSRYVNVLRKLIRIIVSRVIVVIIRAMAKVKIRKLNFVLLPLREISLVALLLRVVMRTFK